jgi:hypothetical protein
MGRELGGNLPALDISAVGLGSRAAFLWRPMSCCVMLEAFNERLTLKLFWNNQASFLWHFGLMEGFFREVRS